eukprot:9385520-Pyramimonas_sp.AAC.1
MGWSWALYFCHSAVSLACRRAQEALGLPPVLVGDRQPPPPLGPGVAVCAPYVDNANVLGSDKST